MSENNVKSSLQVLSLVLSDQQNKPKYIQFTVMYTTEKLQNLTFKKLKPANNSIFCLIKQLKQLKMIKIVGN